MNDEGKGQQPKDLLVRTKEFALGVIRMYKKGVGPDQQYEFSGDLLKYWGKKGIKSHFLHPKRSL